MITLTNVSSAPLPCTNGDGWIVIKWRICSSARLHHFCPSALDAPVTYLCYDWIVSFIMFVILKEQRPTISANVFSDVDDFYLTMSR
jgi:hypothetical protein